MKIVVSMRLFIFIVASVAGGDDENKRSVRNTIIEEQIDDDVNNGGASANAGNRKQRRTSSIKHIFIYGEARMSAYYTSHLGDGAAWARRYLAKLLEYIFGRRSAV